MQNRTKTNEPLSRRTQAKRNAFTLVELLVVITVMVSLGGMLAYALASATTDARIKRTQADLLSLGQLLQSRLNEVSLAKVNLIYAPTSTDVSQPAFGPGSPAGASYINNGQLARLDEARFIRFEAAERARLILMARRDQLRMVLPECQADLLYPPATLQFRTRDTRTAATAAGSPVQYNPNVAQVKPPGQWNQMRTLLGLLSAESIDAQYASSNPATDPRTDAILEAGNATFEALLRQRADGTPMTWTREHESSECLYLILATTELFGKKAIDQIPNSRIQDTDSDGVPEILDSWGEPYMFIRNPIGLRNAAIKNFKPSGATPEEVYPIDPDTLDLLTSDFRYIGSYRPSPNNYIDQAYFPIYLPPVLISSGRDREFGILGTFVDTDGDGAGDRGVSRGYSASAVELPRNSIGPTYQFTDSGNQTFRAPAWRFPDPFFDVSTTPIGAGGNFVMLPEGIEKAKREGGLGTILIDQRDVAADNITSLDAGF